MYNTLGIDVGGTRIKSARIADDGTVLQRSSVSTERSSPEALLDQIVTLVSDVSDRDTRAVGLAVAGAVDPRTGVVDPETTNLPISGYAVGSTVSASTGIHTVVVRDANAALVGEIRAGAARGMTNVVMLTLGTGVGGAAMVDGHIVSGMAGGGGELGHLTLDVRGRRCLGTCKGHGHLEAYASATAIEAMAIEWADKRPSSVLAEMRRAGVHIGTKEVVAVASDGDEAACELLEESATFLGHAVESYVHIFNPEVIIIGGGVAQAGDLLLGHARRMAQELVPGPSRAAVEIAELGTDAGVFGAAALALESIPAAAGDFGAR